MTDIGYSTPEWNLGGERLTPNQGLICVTGTFLNERWQLNSIRVFRGLASTTQARHQTRLEPGIYCPCVKISCLNSKKQSPKYETKQTVYLHTTVWFWFWCHTTETVLCWLVLSESKEWRPSQNSLCAALYELFTRRASRSVLIGVAQDGFKTLPFVTARLPRGQKTRKVQFCVGCGFLFSSGVLMVDGDTIDNTGKTQAALPQTPQCYRLHVKRHYQ